MAAHLGPAAEPYNLTVRRQELPMHEPRLKPAMGAGYAVAPVGADHEMNMHDTAYLRPGGMRRVNSALAEPLGPLSRTALDEKKSVVFYHELNWAHFLDCALICQFYCYDYAQMAEALSGVTGVEYGIHDILAIGERAQTLSRLLNLREGSGAAEDRLPRRVMTAFASGPIQDSGITDEDFAWFLRRFYERMGWDPETGEPTAERLEALGVAGLLGS